MINLRKYHELDDLERMALINMSYSRFSTFDMCPAKYYFTYIQKEDRLFGPAATLGNAIHETLELSTGRGTLNEKEMLDLQEKSVEKYDPKGDIPADLLQAGRQMVSEFVQRHEDDPYFIDSDQIIAQELPFDIIVGACRIIGYIDLVYKDKNGNVTVLDFKSGKFQIPDKDVSTDLQLGIYALALSQLYPEQEDFHAELYYLRDGTRKGHTFKEADLEQICDRILEVYEDMISSTEKGFAANAPAFKCKYMCDFGKSGVCGRGAYIVSQG